MKYFQLPCLTHSAIRIRKTSTQRPQATSVESLEWVTLAVLFSVLATPTSWSTTASIGNGTRSAYLSVTAQGWITAVGGVAPVSAKVVVEADCGGGSASGAGWKSMEVGWSWGSPVLGSKCKGAGTVASTLVDRSWLSMHGYKFETTATASAWPAPAAADHLDPWVTTTTTCSDPMAFRGSLLGTAESADHSLFYNVGAGTSLEPQCSTMYRYRMLPFVQEDPELFFTDSSGVDIFRLDFAVDATGQIGVIATLASDLFYNSQLFATFTFTDASGTAFGSPSSAKTYIEAQVLSFLSIGSPGESPDLFGVQVDLASDRVDFSIGPEAVATAHAVPEPRVSQVAMLGLSCLFMLRHRFGQQIRPTIST